MRSGIVEAVNPARGMVAIATKDDGFTIIELMSDWELEIGDAISWENGYGMGSEVYQNRTKRPARKYMSRTTASAITACASNSWYKRKLGRVTYKAPGLF